MPSTSFFARVDRACSRRSGAAFTLIEAVVVLVVTGVLLGIAGVAFRSVSRHQEDQAGKPLLGSAQTEARRAAASNGYLFPSDLVTRLSTRTAVVDGAGTAKLSYTSAASYAPKTAGNNSVGYVISTAAAGGTAAFAVETTPSHCWTMIDRTNSGQVKSGSDVRRATTWGYSENVSAGQCKADLVMACPDQTAAGTVDQPSAALLGAACSGPSATFAAVKCNIADDSGSDSASVTWSEAADLSGVGGYRLYAWAGGVDQANLSDSSLLTADLVKPARGSAPLPVGTTSTTVSGLLPGTDYTFAVIPEAPATFPGAQTGATDSASVEKLRSAQYKLPTVRMVPAAATSLSTASGAKSLKISWAKAAGASSYKVMRAPSPGTAWAEIDSVTAKDPQPASYVYDDETVVPGQMYSYKVVAANDEVRSDVCGVNTTSGGRGPDSIIDGPFTVDITAPVLSGQSVDDDNSWNSSTRATEGDDVKLTWPAVADADGYRIFRNADPVAIATVSADELSYVDTNRPHGAATSYTATAYADTLESSQSNTVTVYTQMDVPVLTAKAADVDGDGRTHEVALTWTPVGGAVNYTVLGCEGVNCIPVAPAVATVTAPSTAWNNMNGVEGQTLRYRVVANHSVPTKVDSTTSATAQAVLKMSNPVLKAAKFDQGGDGNINDVRLTWPSVPGASGYRVYRDGVKQGGDLTAGTLAFVDVNRPDGSTQYYTVVAFNTYTSTTSNKVRVDIALDAPELEAETVEAGGDGAEDDIKLTWPAVTGVGITYDLYRVGTATPFRTGLTTLTFTDMDRAYGATHCYTAIARSTSGASSAMSEQACSDIALKAPSITANDSGQNAIVTWPAVPGATQYSVYRNPTVSSGTVTNLGTLLATTSALTYTDAGRPWGSTATYVVVAKKAGAIDSAPSNVATVLHIPAVPVTNVRASYCQRCETRLIVTYPTGSTSMQLYRDNTLIKTFVPTSTPNGATYADPTGWGQGHTYTMTATNSSGSSAKSAPDAAYQPPAAPVVVSVAGATGANMTIDWNPSVGADRYYVYVDGKSVWSGTSTVYTHPTNPGQQYTVQVYAYDSNSANPNKFSRAYAPKLYIEPLSSSLWGESGAGLSVKIPWEFAGGYDLDLGSFAVNSGIAYCFDFWARGPGSQSATAWGHYPYKVVGAFQKQKGYVPPVNGGHSPGPSSINGPISTNSEEDRLSRALGRYGASKNDTTTTAALHYSRLLTVGDATQRSYEGRRWGAIVDKYGSGPTKTFDTINADASSYEGPYVAKLTYLDKPVVGQATRVQVSVVGVDGRRIPNATVTVSFDRAHSPLGLVTTDSSGQAQFNIVADCVGTMTAGVFATWVTPDDVTIATPKDTHVQRVMRAGLVAFSPTSTYTSSIDPS